MSNKKENPNTPKLIDQEVVTKEGKKYSLVLISYDSIDFLILIIDCESGKVLEIIHTTGADITGMYYQRALEDPTNISEENIQKDLKEYRNWLKEKVPSLSKKEK